MAKYFLRYLMEKWRRRWEIRYKFNKKHLALDAIILGAAMIIISMLLFWVFGGLHYLIDKTNIEISLRNESVTVGQENIFVINYENGNDFDLDEFSIAIKLPQGFVLKTTNKKQYDFEHNLLDVGKLKAGAGGSLELNGEIWGSLAEKQRLVVNVNYYKTDRQGQKLWGLFQTPYLFEYKISKSDVVLVTNFPDKAVNGQAWNLEISVTNGLNIPLNKIFVQPALNESFTIDNLQAKETRKISGAMTLSGDKTINQQVSVLTEIAGKKIEIAKISKTIELIDSNFVATLSRENKLVQPNGGVDFVIKYANNGKSSLSDVKFKLELMGDYWSAASKTITAQDFSRLALIQPNENGEIPLKIGIKKYFAGALPILQARLIVFYNLGKLPVEMPSSELTIPLSSNLGLTAAVRYFTDFGEQLGRGPLPPKIGAETKYWIFVGAVNDINNVENVRVEATLAKNVSWLDKFNVTVGDALEFDETARRVVWQISEIPTGAQNFGFAFEVGLTPTADQKGAYAELVKNIMITGKDSVTGQELVFSVEPLTTNLIADKVGWLKGGKVK
ncbi:MAG: hypothetical protein V1902_03820 [Candidatus Falkowbacteria bacterium]